MSEEFNMIGEFNVYEASGGKFTNPADRKRKCPVCDKLYNSTVLKCLDCDVPTKAVLLKKR